MQEGEFDAAEHWLQQATSRFPVVPAAFPAHATVAERLSHFDAARRSLIQYEALVSSDADLVQHATRIAALSLRLNDVPTATEWIRKGLDKDAQNVALLAMAERISSGQTASGQSRPAARPQGN